jgi:FkbM family methyltransferase
VCNAQNLTATNRAHTVTPVLGRILHLSAQDIIIADIGAAFLGETPPYQPLLESGIGQLFAFEPDQRQVDTLRRHLGAKAVVIAQAVGDGREHILHVCDHGWSSLFEPDPAALAFFNSFAALGRVIATQAIQTRRLDDIAELPPVDFLKMDVQGAELMVLQNGRAKLADCVAVQLETSFVTLYKGQPPFGAVDLEMRAQGFIPHRFMDVKRWSIAPAIAGNDPRVALNQLLESDIVYIRDLTRPEGFSDLQLKKLAAIAHLYRSPDLAVRCLTLLEARGAVSGSDVLDYLTAQGLKR